MYPNCKIWPLLANRSILENHFLISRFILRPLHWWTIRLTWPANQEDSRKLIKTVILQIRPRERHEVYYQNFAGEGVSVCVFVQYDMLTSRPGGEEKYRILRKFPDRNEKVWQTENLRARLNFVHVFMWINIQMDEISSGKLSGKNCFMSSC